jgi:hypothetical protein
MGCFLTSKTPKQAGAPKYRTIVIRPPQIINVPLVVPPKGGVVVYMIKQPDSQTVLLGSNAMFSVLAAQAPPVTTNGISYQWQINPVQLNGNLYWTNIPGATNSTLVIANAGTNDVGYYRAVAQAGGSTVTSDPVPLVLCIQGSLTVIGTPVVSNPPGTEASCYTNYIGYVLYPDNPNSANLYGFIPIDPTSSASVADISNGRRDTYIEGDGSRGDGPPLLPCLLTTWTVKGTQANPIPSPGYQIIVYFPSPSPPHPAVPTGNYTLSLGNNFRP